MATATVPAPEVTSEREQRHCPECGSIYECSPYWRHSICPACNGQHIARARAQRRITKPAASAARLDLSPEARPAMPAEVFTQPLSPLDREFMALRGIATTLEELDEAARARVLAWIVARYGEQSPWLP